MVLSSQLRDAEDSLRAEQSRRAAAAAALPSHVLLESGIPVRDGASLHDDVESNGFKSQERHSLKSSSFDSISRPDTTTATHTLERTGSCPLLSSTPRGENPAHDDEEAEMEEEDDVESSNPSDDNSKPLRSIRFVEDAAADAPGGRPPRFALMRRPRASLPSSFALALADEYDFDANRDPTSKRVDLERHDPAWWWWPYLLVLSLDNSTRAAWRAEGRGASWIQEHEVRAVCASPLLKSAVTKATHQFFGAPLRPINVPVFVTPHGEPFDVLFAGGVEELEPGMANRVLRGEVRVLVANFIGFKRKPRPSRPTPRDLPAKEVADDSSLTRLGVRFAAAEAQGLRSAMEDRHVVVHVGVSQENVLGTEFVCFALFDGHSGAAAATMGAELMCESLNVSLRNRASRSVNDVVLETFARVESKVISAMSAAASETEERGTDGATAIVCVVTSEHELVVANLGDSRAVLFCGGVAKLLTVDHRGDNQSERERVVLEGGFINYIDGVPHVGDRIQVTRALGDWNHSTGAKIKGVSATPELFRFTLSARKDTDSSEFLIIGCDGVWEKLNEREAVRAVCGSLRRHKGDRQRAAQDLVKLALERGSTDNVSVLIVFFLPSERYGREPEVVECASTTGAEGVRPRLFAPRAGPRLSLAELVKKQEAEARLRECAAQQQRVVVVEAPGSPRAGEQPHVVC